MKSRRSVKMLMEKRASDTMRGKLSATLDVLTDAGLMKQIAKSQSFYKAGKRGLSFEDVFGESVTPVEKRRKA
jgi:hypothetical protein